MTENNYYTQQNMEEYLLLADDFMKKNKAGSIGEIVCPCFVSCDIKERTYTAAFDTDERVVNPNGVMHGGMIATAMDNAMGNLASFYGEGKLTQTVSLQVSYLRPGVVGETLMVCAHCSKPGKTVQYITSEAWLAGKEDKPIATSTSVFYTKGERI